MAVEDLARAMFERTVESVVIVDDERVAGIVTDRDLMIDLLAVDGDASLSDPDVSVDEITAAGVMTTAPLTVTTEVEAVEDARIDRLAIRRPRPKRGTSDGSQS